jgi:hypothetical protein
MPSLRTEQMKNTYKEYLRTHPSDGSCALCAKEAVKAFTHWKILENDFPYDLIAKEHFMLVPKRHVLERDLAPDEISELAEIKAGYIDSTYDYIIEATTKNKSIPAHFHIHLIVA